MLIRRFSVVNFDISSSEGGHGAENEKEINYLPMPRSKDNPNARGGAINILPKAPTERLDYYSSPSKRRPIYDLYDLMGELGIIDTPKRGEGNNVASKRISK